MLTNRLNHTQFLSNDKVNLMLPRNHRSLLRSIEMLESRRLMAGDVSVSLEPARPGRPPTILRIEGDNAGNQVRVIEQDEGVVRVQGLDGTTINGEAADLVLQSSANRIPLTEVNLGNGDDTIEFLAESFSASGKSISTGNGSDVVQIVAPFFAPGVRIDTGNGDDSVLLDYSQSLSISNINIDTGRGDDFVDLSLRESGSISSATGGSVVSTGSGDDIVQLRGRLGGDNRIVIFLDSGDDTLIGDPELTPTSFKITVFGGTGTDTVINASYFTTAFNSELLELETLAD
jgi:hypothetical protein